MILACMLMLPHPGASALLLEIGGPPSNCLLPGRFLAEISAGLKLSQLSYCTELYGGNVMHNAGPILLLISDKVTRNAGCVATKMTKKKSAIFQNFLATTP